VTGAFDRPADRITPFEQRAAIGTVVSRFRSAVLSRSRLVLESPERALLARNGTRDKVLFVVLSTPANQPNDATIDASSGPSSPTLPAVAGVPQGRQLTYRLMPGEELWALVTTGGPGGVLVTEVMV
jgi:hypothetical protein